MLRSHGFEVTERAFEFSAFPGVCGAPVLGASSMLALLTVCACGAAGRPAAALSVLILSGAASVIVGWIVGDAGVLSLPFMRRRGVNLECVRGAAPPRLWLVAHIDSKSQPVPMLLRVASVGLLVVCSGAALAIGVEQQTGLIGTTAWRWLAAASALAGLPLLLSFVAARNTGAVDNASGVATVLAAVERMAPGTGVGVLITDAEELALAGARAWCVGRPAAVALNCDTIDDHGTLTIMTVGRGRGASRNRPPRDGTSRDGTLRDGTLRDIDVVAELRSAARTEGERIRVIPLIPGILTDSVGFAAAGWQTVTISRGTIGTLGRIHSTRDDVDHLRGAGIGGAANVLARAATELTRVG